MASGLHTVEYESKAVSLSFITSNTSFIYSFISKIWPQRGIFKMKLLSCAADRSVLTSLISGLFTCKILLLDSLLTFEENS